MEIINCKSKVEPAGKSRILGLALCPPGSNADLRDLDDLNDAKGAAERLQSS